MLDTLVLFVIVVISPSGSFATNSVLAPDMASCVAVKDALIASHKADPTYDIVTIDCIPYVDLSNIKD